MVGFINSLNPSTHHCFGFNNLSYDRLMIGCLFMYIGIYNTTRELITKLYETSKKIIESQDNKDASKKHYYLSSLKENIFHYLDIDIFRIFALNKLVNKLKKMEEYFGKRHKQTSINIKWYELLEYELPPINEEESLIYDKKPRYSRLTKEKLNRNID